MTRPDGFRIICVALCATVLAFSSTPASADSRDHGFASTANSIINLLDSPETPAPQKSTSRAHRTNARPHVPRQRPVAAAKPQHRDRPTAVAAKPQPSQPRPVVAARPQPPQPRPVVAAKPQPAPVIASRPQFVEKPAAPVVLPRPQVREKPKHVVALGAATTHAHKRAHRARVGAMGGHGIPIVKPWGGKIPDNYCDLPTGCASPAPVPEDHITY